MGYNFSQNEEVNVLASDANWAWPKAVHDIFQPRGINLLVAQDVGDFVDIIKRRRIHTAIVDMESERSNGLMTVKIIRMDYPLVPCILLSNESGEDILSKALRLNVFSVIDKPVDMGVLREQLNKLFMKRYDSHIFE
ncbi:MAG: response regulator [Planctomycetes bacterium]|nr:response regulator [Planctomycetota bacterium]